MHPSPPARFSPVCDFCFVLFFLYLTLTCFMNVKIGCAEKRVRPSGERGGFARPVCFFQYYFSFSWRRSGTPTALK